MSEQSYWYWPLYRLTSIALVVTAATLMTANYLAMSVPTPCLEDGKFGPNFSIDREYRHGWPLTYCIRHRWRDRNPSFSGNFEQFSVWHPWEGVKEFSLTSLVCDLLISTACLAAACAALQWWRFRHQTFGQFTIADLCAVAVCLSLCFAWIANTRLEYRRETRLLNAEYQRLDDPTRERYGIETRASSMPGFLPEHYEEKFDDLFGCVVNFSGDPDFACQFRHLMAYHAGGPAKDTLARCLSKMPQLEGLKLVFSGFHSSEDGIWNDGFNAVPTMERLKGINLFDTGVTEEDLLWMSKCVQLETIYFRAEDGVNDNGIRHLSQLPRLKRFAVVFSRPECQMTDIACSSIADMKNLESLHIEGDKITNSGIREFVRLKRLKRLWLSTSASEEATESLKQQMPWCEITDLAAQFRRENLIPRLPGSSEEKAP